MMVYAPTFRGRGAGKRAVGDLDAPRLRAAIGPDDLLVLKAHPNLDPALTDTAGFDLVIDPVTEINDLLTVTDILITDYSSSIFEFALLRRPLVLLVPDLETYETDPGLYLDYRTEMIGTQVVDTDGVIEAIATVAIRPGRLRRVHRAPPRAGDGHASERFVERFLGPGRGPASRQGRWYPSARCPPPREAPAAFRNAAGDPGALRLDPGGHRRHPVPPSARPLSRAQADMRKRGADTLLGNLWWVLDPLLQMVVYCGLRHDHRARKPLPDYPLFIFAAILPWKWFTASVVDATRP